MKKGEKPGRENWGMDDRLKQAGSLKKTLWSSMIVFHWNFSPHKFAIFFVTFLWKPQKGGSEEVNKIKFEMDLKAKAIPSCTLQRATRKEKFGCWGQDEMGFMNRQRWRGANSKKCLVNATFYVARSLFSSLHKLLSFLHRARFNVKLLLKSLNKN